MFKNFLPKNFNIRQSFILETCKLELLTTKQVVEDYFAVLANAEMIIKLRPDSGGNKVSKETWPFKFSLEENYKDLAWLEVCASYKQLCAYIIRDLKTNQYIACVYLYPITLFYPEKAKDFDLDFSFWLSKSAYQQGRYNIIYKELAQWLHQSWPFSAKRIFWRVGSGEAEKML